MAVRLPLYCWHPSVWACPHGCKVSSWWMRTCKKLHVDKTFRQDLLSTGLRFVLTRGFSRDKLLPLSCALAWFHDLHPFPQVTIQHEWCHQPLVNEIYPLVIICYFVKVFLLMLCMLQNYCFPSFDKITQKASWLKYCNFFFLTGKNIVTQTWTIPSKLNIRQALIYPGLSLVSNFRWSWTFSAVSLSKT